MHPAATSPSSPVVTFGELMLRLTTPAHQRFSQAEHFEITFGGAEANVAVALAQLGRHVEFVTRLPPNALGERALDELRRVRVGVQYVARGGDRLGAYFLEQGASQRPANIIYDRGGSAFATATNRDFDWANIFKGAAWFHWSGITPALSESAADMVGQACATARDHRVVVSFDLNYRSKLWTLDRAQAVLTPLMKHVQLCICSAEEATTVFGLRGDSDRELADKICERFGCETVALTKRESSSASCTAWAAALFTASDAFLSRRYEIDVIDRIGAGDAFSGALIASLLDGEPPPAALEFAVAAGALKHTISGDYALLTRAEVDALRAGAHGGRVRR